MQYVVADFKTPQGGGARRARRAARPARGRDARGAAGRARPGPRRGAGGAEIGTSLAFLHATNSVSLAPASACTSPRPPRARPIRLPPAATTPVPPPPSPSPPASSSPAGARQSRTPEAILADAVTATGGAAAWNAHKTAHYKMETTLQGMGMGGRASASRRARDKSLTIMEMTGLGQRPRRDQRQGRLDRGSAASGSATWRGPRRSRRGSVRRGTPTCTRRSCSRSSRPRPSPGRTASRSSA